MTAEEMMKNNTSGQSITDKFLELINTPNTTDTYVVVEMINYLGLRIGDDPYAKWGRNTSSTTKIGEETNE